MYDIVVASHGNFSKGILDTLLFFLPEAENIKTVSLGNEGIESFENEITSVFNDLSDRNVIVFVDLFHGTPFNVCSKNISLIKGESELVAGVNVPMLLDAAFNSKEKSVSEEVDSIRKMTLVNILSDEVKNQRTSDEDE